MNYMVGGQKIKSENAAKSHTQQSKYVCEYLKSHDVVNKILDFGCGKLRYSNIIVDLCHKATFVDSKIQLQRTQIIRGKKTSVKKYVTLNYPECQVIAFEDLNSHHHHYNIITCINVLSAIPNKNTIIAILNYIKIFLRKNGKAIIINQHQNSYFEKYKSGSKHLYGYLYKGNGRTSYYGIMGPNRVEQLLKKSGFTISCSWAKGGVNIVEAKL